MKAQDNILNILCCPNCKSDLKQMDDTNIICSNCNSKYRKKDGMWILISKELEEELRR